MRKLSVGMRLTLWYVAIFAVGELVFGASMFLILRHNLYDLEDDGLESQIEDLRNFLGAQQKDASTAKLRDDMAAIVGPEHVELALRLRELRPAAKERFATYEERRAYFQSLVAEALG